MRDGLRGHSCRTRHASGPPVTRRLLAALALAACATLTGSAHIGSPNVFLDGAAGPYRLLITIRPPYAIPGVAEVEVLATSDDVNEVRIVPLPLTGPGAQFAPVPDVARRSTSDPRLFTGSLWMMTAGAWQVRVAADGDRGLGEVAVPVPTLPNATLEMGPRAPCPAHGPDAAARYRVHCHHRDDGARGRTGSWRRARRRAAPAWPDRGHASPRSSSRRPCISATSGGAPKRLPMPAMCTSRSRRAPRCKTTGVCGST